MRSHDSNGKANNRSVSRIWLKLALVSLVALLLVTLPQMFGAHAGAAPAAPQGFLFTVTTTDDHNDFVCDGTDCTLREAIQAANNAPTEDTIDFSVTGVINLGSGLPDISGSVTIEGPGADMLTVRRDTGGEYRIFTVMTTGTVTFSGLTISNGVGTPEVSIPFTRGGGINNALGGTVNITNCTISDNSAEFGGGIHNRGRLSVTNSRISENSAIHISGDGIFNGSGGGVFNASTDTVTVTDSIISDNSAEFFGGGIDNATFFGTVTVTNTTISDNSANTGSGIYNSGTVIVTNSTISNNFTDPTGSGGGIFNTGTATVTNSTISHNSADSGGGGIDTSIAGTVNVKSSIIAVNIARAFPDVFGRFASHGFNLIGIAGGLNGFTAPTDLTGTPDSPLDPGLDPNGLQENGGPTKTIALVCGSAAIDKGTSMGLTGQLTTDQRGSGFPRTIDDPLFPNANDIQGDGTDIGAFELDTQNCNHPPVAQCRNIQVSADNNCQATITPEQIDNGSFDPDKGDSIATRTLDNSGPFGLGTHPVTLTVTDTHGASSSCTATVTVVDTTPPTLTCPPNQSVPATPGQCQAIVNYPNPTISDNCQGAMLVGCVPPSGSTFQVGATPVTCTAQDAAGNTGTCQFQVIVFDNQPPSITCPANVTSLTDQSACPNPACQIVSYPPPVVSDNCPGATAVCNPPAGSCFPTGVTTVTCTANDTAGNTASCSFTVTVFDVALQDDSNPGTILLWNSITGAYRFCCNDITFTGVGKPRVQGCVYTLEHNPADRRVLGRVDKAVHSGSGAIQAPAGTIRCTITDRNILNDTNLISCQ